MKPIGASCETALLPKPSFSSAVSIYLCDTNEKQRVTVRGLEGSTEEFKCKPSCGTAGSTTFCNALIPNPRFLEAHRAVQGKAAQVTALGSLPAFPASPA